jgi:hypothetical protein
MSPNLLINEWVKFASWEVHAIAYTHIFLITAAPKFVLYG